MSVRISGWPAFFIMVALFFFLVALCLLGVAAVRAAWHIAF